VRVVIGEASPLLRAVLAGMAEGESTAASPAGCSSPSAPSSATSPRSSPKLGVRASENGHRRVLAVLTYLGR
jgi:hypothetical protein